MLFYDIYKIVSEYDQEIPKSQTPDNPEANLVVKNRFLLFKSSTLEHTLVKRISCEIYTPYIGRGVRNILRGNLHQEMGI